jgi:hypothetical protein
MTATKTNNVIEVENILCGFQFLQVLVLLENVVLKLSQFQTKQKSSQQAGTPGAMKGDKTLYFLTEMCEVHKLNKTGTLKIILYGIPFYCITIYIKVIL